MTPDTQFYIASTTKSFTALAGAILAARGEFDLDMPVSDALPSALFHPEVAADQISLRDLLTHTHGLPNGPVDFRSAFTGDVTSDQLLDLLRFHGPPSPSRAFRYSNLGYNIFGLVLESQFEESWKDVIQREVFEPLGMQQTTAWISRASRERLAQPYVLSQAGPERVRFAKDDQNMQAAGGHVSTSSDLARYVLAQINGGQVAGRQAIPEAVVQETHRLQAAQDREYGSFGPRPHSHTCRHTRREEEVSLGVVTRDEPDPWQWQPAVQPAHR